MSEALHPKQIRRRILEILYREYLKRPLELLHPEEFLADGNIPSQELFVNACYLHDRGLIQVKHGYNPARFNAVRITPDGMDLVENRVAFDTLFPPHPNDLEQRSRLAPSLIEKLVEEGDFAPLDGEERICLHRDIHYLREELARPAERWRHHVVWTVISWIEGYFDRPEETLPSLEELKHVLEDVLGYRMPQFGLIKRAD